MKQSDDLRHGIEQLIPLCQDKSDAEIAGLLYEDYHTRVQNGERPSRKVYLERFPELGDLLHRFFDVHDALGSASLSDEISQLADDSIHDGNLFGEVVFGDFRITREISRSLMGTVYEAEQLSLSRKVALKMLHRLFGLDPGRRRRFLIEAQLAATMQIDGIVPVLCAGEQEGICYYTMPFIEGCTLGEFLSAKHRSPPEDEETPHPIDSLKRIEADSKQIAMLLAGVSRALHAAHEQGIVHRDIKPTNILVDHSHKAWLSDFGLARSPDAETLTKTGDLLGTYYYMSPEQIMGSAAKVDRRSDIYALGATLYETLGGQPPFVRQKPPQLIQAILESDPTSLRKLDPAVPRPLEAIVRKAMSKSPSDRYDTSEEFAADLERYVRDEPIQADSCLWAEGRRWWRQHQKMMSIVAITCATAILGLFLGMQTRLTELRELNQDLLRSEEYSANLRYATDMQLAYDAMQTRNFSRVRSLVERHDAQDAGCEHQILASFLQQYAADCVLPAHKKIVRELMYLPESHELISTSDDQTICIWDLATETLVDRIEVDGPVAAVAISPDGEIAAFGVGSRVELWDSARRRRIRVITNHDADVDSLAFSPDGTLLASGSRYEAIHVNTLNGDLVAQVYSGARVEQLAFSADGTTLYGNRRTQWSPVIIDCVTAWRLEDGSLHPTVTFEFPNGSMRRFVLDEPQERLLVSLRYGGGLHAFDLTSGELLFSNQTWAEANSWVCNESWAAFGAPSGQVQILGRDGSSASLVHSWRAHEGYVEFMLWLPDGRLVTCGEDGLIKIWPRLQPFLTKQRLADEHLVAPIFVDGGRRIAHLASNREQVHLLRQRGTPSVVEFAEPIGHFVLDPHQDCLVGFEVNDDGDVRQLVSASLPSNDVARYSSPHNLHTASHSPSGDHIAVGDTQGELTLLHAKGLTPIWRQRVGSVVWSQAFSPDGRRIACGIDHGGVVVVSADDGQILFRRERVLGLNAQPTCLVWSHDGRRIAVAGRNGNHSIGVCRLDETLATEHVLVGHDGGLLALRFSPDDRTLVSMSADQTIRFWNLTTGEMAGTLPVDGEHNFFPEGLYVDNHSIGAIVGTPSKTELWRWNAARGRRRVAESTGVTKIGSSKR